MDTVEKSAVASRRFGVELDEAIRQAVRDELADNTYAGVTFEGVAKRAKTSKPVIYRRYSTRAQMVIDAWVRYAPEQVAPFVTSGELREDLLSLARAFADRFERIGVETMRGLLAEIAPEQMVYLTSPSPWIVAALTAIFDAARARDDITRPPLPQRIRSLPLVLVRDELMFTGAFGDEALTEIIDQIWLPLLVASD